jgi:two-component sensor histidine kinase
MPTGLVVNEIMTNAFKYAFSGRESGTVMVHCLRQGNSCSVLVADDGVGFPPDYTWPPSGRISALIVQSLRENAKADLRVESSGRGTAISFAVPVLARTIAIGEKHRD